MSGGRIAIMVTQVCLPTSLEVTRGDAEELAGMSDSQVERETMLAINFARASLHRSSPHIRRRLPGQRSLSLRYRYRLIRHRFSENMDLCQRARRVSGEVAPNLKVFHSFAIATKQGDLDGIGGRSPHLVEGAQFGIKGKRGALSLHIAIKPLDGWLVQGC